MQPSNDLDIPMHLDRRICSDTRYEWRPYLINSIRVLVHGSKCHGYIQGVAVTKPSNYILPACNSFHRSSNALQAGYLAEVGHSIVLCPKLRLVCQCSCSIELESNIALICCICLFKCCPLFGVFLSLYNYGSHVPCDLG